MFEILEYPSVVVWIVFVVVMAIWLIVDTRSTKFNLDPNDELSVYYCMATDELYVLPFHNIEELGVLTVDTINGPQRVIYIGQL